MSSAQTGKSSTEEMSRIIALAERVFGDPKKANRWLAKPSRMIGQRVPLDLLRTEAGARQVEQALHRIDHGILA
jgi:putative toxin-antitoxin system antitoxin component (TIGR02293 family)